MKWHHKLAGFQAIHRAVNGVEARDYVPRAPGSDKDERLFAQAFDDVETYNPLSAEGVKAANQDGAFGYRAERTMEVPAQTNPSRQREPDQDHSAVSVDRAWLEHEGFDNDKAVAEIAEPGPAL